MDNVEYFLFRKYRVKKARIAGMVLGLLLLVVSGVAAAEGTGLQSRRETVRQGIRVELDVTPVTAEGSTKATVLEGELATITLKLSDAVSGTPITAMFPKVWLDLQKQFKGEKKGQPAITCSDKVRSYLQGTLSFRPDVDLNSYYILTLNNDATIGVIDPIRGVAGYSQLLAMIALSRPGEDWVYSRDEKTLFVTMPKAGQVAVIDTENFKVQKNIAAGNSPFRIALQPDGRYLWVGNNAEDGSSGVTILDALSNKVVAWLPTGAGHHELAFSDDSTYAFVSNRDSGTVSIIDVQRLKIIKNLATGKQPVSMAFSKLGKALYVAHEGDGAVVAIDGVSLEMAGRISLEAGIKALRFAPGDRWGFVVNPKTRQLSVFDVSSNSVTYSGEVGNQPEHIAFSSEFAYIRSKKTAEVTLITLANLGKGDKMTPLRISGGGIAPSESTIQPSLADNIVVTPEGNAVLIASPADATIVYYMEGMGVPAGNFRTYGRVPRAVSIVNRRLRETVPGIYSATFRVPASGKYDAVFLLDSPRLIHCFDFDASVNPVVSTLKAARPVEIEFMERGVMLASGVSQKLHFRLRDAANGQVVPDVKDVSALVTLMPTGTWRQTFLADSAGEGVYEIDFKPPRAGKYSLYFTIPSLQVKINQIRPIELHVQ
jgi:YVTN family beta-propeller protein